MSVEERPKSYKRLIDVLGIAVNLLAEEHVFTFMLSSTFTARTIVHEKKQVDEVKQDLLISFIMSSLIGVIVGMLLKSWAVAISGIVIALIFYFIYAWRGNLL